MGMFDSLNIEIDGYELQLQTKRFDSGLASYRLGDWVAGCMPGVRVYFYPLWLNDEGKQPLNSKSSSRLNPPVCSACSSNTVPL